MSKVIYCKDAGNDCTEVIRGQTEEEVLQKAAEHAKQHGLVEVTPALATQLRGLIKEE